MLTETGKNRLEADQVQAMLDACLEVADGKLDGEFGGLVIEFDVIDQGGHVGARVATRGVVVDFVMPLPNKLGTVACTYG